MTVFSAFLIHFNNPHLYKDHEIVKKLEELYNSDKEKLKEYSKILYSQARLIEGLSIENPTEISNLICEYLSK